MRKKNWLKKIVHKKINKQKMDEKKSAKKNNVGPTRKIHEKNNAQK